jgi:hypothetical protein
VEAVRIHILTAVTRPENLPRLAQSIAEACERCPDAEVVWHWEHDRDGRHVGGQALKNLMLSRVDWGWVYILDDDTIVHPDLFRRVQEAEYYVNGTVIIVNQLRADGRTLQAAREHTIPGMVDIGQAVISAEILNGDRIPESYEGDGEFLMGLVSRLDASAVVYLDETLSYHNYLRPGTH